MTYVINGDGEIMIKHMEDMTSEEFGEHIERGGIVILPVGSVEEHGPHLPLATDCYQPLSLVDKIADRLDAAIAPIVYYGNCNSTSGFPGTVSIEPETLRALIRDILLSLCSQAVRRIAVISGHAGRNHMASLKMAARDAVKRNQEARIMVFSDYDYAYGMDKKWDIPEWDGHAGTIETARIMALRPELVRKPLPPGHRAEFPRFVVEHDVRDIIPRGYWGDPSRATEKMGREINEYLLEKIVKDMKKGLDV